MINLVEPLPVGNALRVLFSPAEGSKLVRILRKTVDVFADESDPEAFIVFDDFGDAVVIDTTSLSNGATYFYKQFDFDGSVWSGSPSVSGQPQATALQVEVDALEIMRSRLEAGFRAAVQAGKITHEFGHVPVFTAPPQFEGTKFPVVTVHLQSDEPEGRGIGEGVLDDKFDVESNDWIESDGWQSRVRLQIIGWCLNPDERIALRKAMKAVIIGNLLVFDQHGMVLPEVSFSDLDDMESYSAPVYQSMAMFSCLAPSTVSSTIPAVEDVTVTATVAGES